MTLRIAALALLVSAPLVAQDLPIKTLRLKADPGEARVRPLETIVVQARAYGEVPDGEGVKEARLQKGGATWKLEGLNSGWISKPFRFQGKEDEAFYQSESGGLGAVIFGQMTARYVLQDSVLYSAPDKPGRYKIRAELEGKSAEIEIRVEASAPSTKKSEKTNFGSENRQAEPYRTLAEHYAPFVAQETWFQPKSDYLARFDLDGDWKGDNNWDNAEIGSSQAYVHYAAMETGSHWFLIYNFFHPRDYSDKCVAGTCHENDNEGMILTVLKDGSRFGKLQAMETLAHNNVYSLRADRSVRKGVHNIDGDVELHEGSHPVVFIEAGGHGVYGSHGGHSRFDVSKGDFSETTGVTYVYKGRAERPKHTQDRDVGYDLLPIYHYWWKRSVEGSGRNQSFDEYYSYQPFGNRPRPTQSRIAGSFLGRKHGANKAKPFWGWHDNRTRKRKVLATGQWGIDPAYGVSQNLRFPQRVNTDYVYNPYLGIGNPGERGAAPAPTMSDASPTAPTGGISYAAKRSSDHNEDRRQGQFDIRLYVDHEVDVIIAEDTIGIDPHGGKRPRDDGSEYSQPLPQSTVRSFRLEQKDGRGQIRLLEAPSASNGYVARLKISDTKSGEDRYHARLTWERVDQNRAVAPPRAPTRGRASSDNRQADGLEIRAPELPGSEVSEPTAPPLLDPAAAQTLPGTELFSSSNNPTAYNSNSGGLFEFRGVVDGVSRFYVRGDRVFSEAQGGRPVEVERFSFSQPLPSRRLRDVRVERKDGRGDVRLVQQPAAGNGYTAIIEVREEKSGDDRYHFRLTWRR